MERKYTKMHIMFWSTATHMTVDLETSQIENWKFDESKYVNEKVSDQCHLKFETKDGEMSEYQGYVPDFFPEEHYGDYIILPISKEGVIQELKVTDKEIDDLLEEDRKYRECED